MGEWEPPVVDDKRWCGKCRDCDGLDNVMPWDRGECAWNRMRLYRALFYGAVAIAVLVCWLSPRPAQASTGWVGTTVTKEAPVAGGSGATYSIPATESAKWKIDGVGVAFQERYTWAGFGNGLSASSGIANVYSGGVARFRIEPPAGMSEQVDATHPDLAYIVFVQVWGNGPTSDGEAWGQGAQQIGTLQAYLNFAGHVQSDPKLSLGVSGMSHPVDCGVSAFVAEPPTRVGNVANDGIRPASSQGSARYAIFAAHRNWDGSTRWRYSATASEGFHIPEMRSYVTTGGVVTTSSVTLDSIKTSVNLQWRRFHWDVDSGGTLVTSSGLQGGHTHASVVDGAESHIVIASAVTTDPVLVEKALNAQMDESTLAPMSPPSGNPGDDSVPPPDTLNEPSRGMEDLPAGSEEATISGNPWDWHQYVDPIVKQITDLFWPLRAVATWKD